MCDVLKVNMCQEIGEDKICVNKGSVTLLEMGHCNSATLVSILSSCFLKPANVQKCKCTLRVIGCRRSRCSPIASRTPMSLKCCIVVTGSCPCTLLFELFVRYCNYRKWSPKCKASIQFKFKLPIIFTKIIRTGGLFLVNTWRIRCKQKFLFFTEY